MWAGDKTLTEQFPNLYTITTSHAKNKVRNSKKLKK